MKNKIQIKILTEKLMALKGRKLGLENLLCRFSPPALYRHADDYGGK